jgi:hypothetical protein
MDGTRILVACELTSYREAIAASFRLLRPCVEVFEAEEEDLEREVVRLEPHLVICSKLTAQIEDRAPNWVELYPSCGSRSVISLHGERSTIEDIQLSDLLSAIDDLKVSLDPGQSGPSGVR